MAIEAYQVLIMGLNKIMFWDLKSNFLWPGNVLLRTKTVGMREGAETYHFEAGMDPHRSVGGEHLRTCIQIR